MPSLPDSSAFPESHDREISSVENEGASAVIEAMGNETVAKTFDVLANPNNESEAFAKRTIEIMRSALERKQYEQALRYFACVRETYIPEAEAIAQKVIEEMLADTTTPNETAFPSVAIENLRWMHSRPSSHVDQNYRYKLAKSANIPEEVLQASVSHAQLRLLSTLKDLIKDSLYFSDPEGRLTDSLVYRMLHIQYQLEVTDSQVTEELKERAKELVPFLILRKKEYLAQELCRAFRLPYTETTQEAASGALDSLLDDMIKNDYYSNQGNFEDVIRIKKNYNVPLTPALREKAVQLLPQKLIDSEEFVTLFEIPSDVVRAAAIKKANDMIEASIGRERYREEDDYYDGEYPYVSQLMEQQNLTEADIPVLKNELDAIDSASKKTDEFEAKSLLNKQHESLIQRRLQKYLPGMIGRIAERTLREPDGTSFTHQFFIIRRSKMSDAADQQLVEILQNKKKKQDALHLNLDDRYQRIVFTDLIKKEDSNASFVMMQEAAHYLRSKGMDAAKVGNAWRQASNDAPEYKNDIGRAKVIAGNIAQIAEIERIAPGAAGRLLKKWGIRHFDRYPVELLIQQDDITKSHKVFEQRVMLMLYPVADHNGAFAIKETNKRLLYGSLANEHFPVIAEAESKRECLRALISCERECGKIDAAILGGHGYGDGMNFGKGSGGHFNINDLVLSEDSNKSQNRPIIPELRNFFTDDATIFMKSCSTGRKDGLASKIMKTLNIHTEGPPGGTVLYDIDWSKRKAIYQDMETIRYVPSKLEALPEIKNPKAISRLIQSILNWLK